MTVTFRPNYDVQVVVTGATSRMARAGIQSRTRTNCTRDGVPYSCSRRMRPWQVIQNVRQELRYFAAAHEDFLVNSLTARFPLREDAASRKYLIYLARSSLSSCGTCCRWWRRYGIVTLNKTSQGIFYIGSICPHRALMDSSSPSQRRRFIPSGIRRRDLRRHHGIQPWATTLPCSNVCSPRGCQRLPGTAEMDTLACRTTSHSGRDKGE